MVTMSTIKADKETKRNAYIRNICVGPRRIAVLAIRRCGGYSSPWILRWVLTDYSTASLVGCLAGLDAQSNGWFLRCVHELVELGWAAHKVWRALAAEGGRHLESWMPETP